MPAKPSPSSDRLEALDGSWRLGRRILSVDLRQREGLPGSPLLYKASTGAKMYHGAGKKNNLSQNSIETANRRSQTGRCRDAATTWPRCPGDRSHGGCACEEIATKPAEFGQQPQCTEAVPSREGWRKQKARNQGGSRLFCSICEKGYSAAPSTALVCATVQSGAPTLKRAKRRTVRFSPSLPTFCAISSLMLIAWSLMNGCSRRQTSS